MNLIGVGCIGIFNDFFVKKIWKNRAEKWVLNFKTVYFIFYLILPGSFGPKKIPIPLKVVNVCYLPSKYDAKSLSLTSKASIIAVRPFESRIDKLAPAATSM